MRGVPAADDPAARRAAVETLGLDDDAVAEYAAFVQEHPEITDRLFRIDSGDVEADAQALEANLDLLDQLRAGEDAQGEAYWAQQKLAQTQLEAYTCELTDQAMENPEAAPHAALELLLRGASPDDIGELVELGDEAFGPGATHAYLSQAVAQMQQQAVQAEADAQYQANMAAVQAQWEIASAQDEHMGQMPAPAHELSEAQGKEATKLVTEAISALPQLGERMADPQSARAELERLYAVANEQIRIDQEGRRMVILSNGGDPDSPNPVDRYGHRIEVPDRVVPVELFLPAPSVAEQVLGFRQSFQATEARAAQPAQSKDTEATRIGRQWQAHEVARDMHAAWTGRESRDGQEDGDPLIHGRNVTRHSCSLGSGRPIRSRFAAPRT